jgi:hypothetical protein
VNVTKSSAVKSKERASRADIFGHLQRLAGPEAEPAIRQVVAQLTAGDREEGLETLRAFDARLGGFTLRDVNGQKLIGVYRPMWYVEFHLNHPQPQHAGRAIIHAACSLVEFLLKRMSRWRIFYLVVDDHAPLGKLVSEIRASLPTQIGDDLQWLSSRVYNFAKHDYDVNDRSTPESKEHYFDLDEALAVYFIARRLEVDLEAMSGKSREELMRN